MPKFCRNCGKELVPEQAKFCRWCGTAVLQAPAPASQAKPEPVKLVAQPTKQPAPKKKISRKTLIIALAAALLTLSILLICILGFRDGGWFRKKPTPDAAATQSLRAYAQQLEEAGNYEAAAAIYEKIGQGVGGELIEDAHDEIPVLKTYDDMNQIKDVFSGKKGGNK